MKIMSIHAHFDDFEFYGSGLFEKWRKKESNFQAKVVVCTNGEAGHHFRSRKETGELRRTEQLKSAKIGKYELEFLKYPNGEYPREGSLMVDTPFLAAIWKCIRDFKPDYLFCPPLTSSTIAGIHIDHIAVADAIRKVAYMINVPHCYSPEFNSESDVSEFIKLPVILNFYDPYMKEANDLDFAVCIDDEFEAKAAMSWCHQSQIVEWLPWVKGANANSIPKSLEEYKILIKQNATKINKKLNITKNGLFESYTVTAWGSIPTFESLSRDIPGIDAEAIPLHKLKTKLNSWNS